MKMIGPDRSARLLTRRGMFALAAAAGAAALSDCNGGYDRGGAASASAGFAAGHGAAVDYGGGSEGLGPSESALVVYFSHEGHTRAVAERIAEHTGGDLFEIVPVAPYPAGMAGVASVAEREHDEDARPPIERTVENLGRYETVFLGFPIWYGSAPMVMGTFLEAHDLFGKTVHLFCTSAGSTLEDGGLDFVRRLATGADVGSGVTANSDDALDAWLTGLGH